MRLSWCLPLLLFASCANAAKIFLIFPTFGKSHWAVGEGIMKALCVAGHEVTTISAFPQSKVPAECHKNLKFIYLDGIVERFMKDLPEDLQSSGMPFITTLMISSLGLDHVEETLNHEMMKQFLAQTPPPEFDLVIAESFGNEALYAFGEYFQAPVIAVSTTLNTNWLNTAIGNVEPWSFVPNIQLRTGPKMGFKERLMNVIINSFDFAVLHAYSIPRSTALIRRHLPSVRKSQREILQQDVCLAFVNTHFTIAGPRPYVQNMVEIGGINIDRKVEKLPEDFQNFLDTAEHGVILFSMGSVYQASNWRKEQLAAFIGAFEKLPQRIIWRYNLPDADRLPKNVMAREWLPQKEILAHPNVRLFITHGGMLGTTEGFYHGVPMVGIPMFGDQPMNIGRYVDQGFALELDKQNLTEETVLGAVKEILGNPKYRQRVKALSAAYHDQPMTAQETVVYWSEYVMKHKCPRFLQSPGHAMGIVEYNNLDVWAFIVGIVVVQCWLVVRCVARRRSTKKVKVQ